MAGYTKLYAIPEELYKHFKELENCVEKSAKTNEDDSDLLPIPCEKELNSISTKVAQQGGGNNSVAAAASQVGEAVSLKTIDQDSDQLSQQAAIDETITLKTDRGEDGSKGMQTEEDNSNASVSVENMHEIVFDPASNLTERYEEARSSLPAIHSKTLSIKESIMKFPDIVSLIMGESTVKCSKYKNNYKQKSLKQKKSKKVKRLPQSSKSDVTSKE